MPQVINQGFKQLKDLFKTMLSSFLKNVWLVLVIYTILFWLITGLAKLVSVFTFVTSAFSIVTQPLVYLYDLRPQPQPTKTQIVKEQVEEMFSFATLIVEYALDYLAYFLVAIMIVYLLRKILNNRSFRKIVYRTRGVYIGESMREGSLFNPGKPLSCQMEVMNYGIFGRSFVGYAIRVSDTVLCMPVHVYRKAQNDIVISKDEISYDISSSPMVESPVVSDLCYVKIIPKVFTDMKVSVARFPKKEVTGFVSVTGREGTSSGILTKSLTRGLLNYEGSTKPGYSGAPYFIGNQVYGIHIGDAGTSNLGISQLVIYNDLISVHKMAPVVAEGSLTFSSPSMMGSFEELLVAGNNEPWSDSDFRPKKKFVNVPKVQDPDRFNPTGPLWADEIEEESADLIYEQLGGMNIDSMHSLIGTIQSQIENRTQKVRTQDTEGEEIVVQVAPAVRPTLDSRISALEEEVEKIKKKLSPPKKQQEEIEAYFCPNCPKSFVKMVGLVGHLQAAHDVPEEALDFSLIKKTRGYKPESLASDNSKVVGNGAVFQKKSLFPNKNVRNYSNTSNSRVKKVPSQSMGRNQKNTVVSQQTPQITCDMLQEALRGLILGQLQK